MEWRLHATLNQPSRIQNSRPSTSENESASLLNYLDHVLDRGRMRHIMGISWAYHGLSLIFIDILFSPFVYASLRWCLNSVAFSELNHWMSSFFVGRRNVGARWPLKGWLLPSRGPPFCENKTRNITEHMFDRINASQCPHLKILEAYTALNLFSCGWRSGPFSRKYKAKASSVINHFVIVKWDKA